jgi:predicted P-loop ATPase
MATNSSLVNDVKSFLNDSYQLRYNLITRNIETNSSQINDMHLNSIYLACRSQHKRATKDIVLSTIFSDATVTYNPFDEFINSHKSSRPLTANNIDKLIATIITDTPNYEMFIKKWLCSIIASIHGKHSPLMLVLCGGQNSGKTEWFRRLLPVPINRYYAESKLDGGKDDEILMTQKLIVMDDEMGGKSKQENKKLKEMTSKQTFSLREPYARVSVDLNRLAVLCGTSNELQVLNDPTGNRRLLPIHVLSIDHELYNSIDKIDLFIEIYNLYKSGYNYQLTMEEIKLLNESTGEFEASSLEEEMIFKLYEIPKHNSQNMVTLTNTEIITRIKQITGSNCNPKLLGALMKKLGFEQQVVKRGKITARVYKVIEIFNEGLRAA